MGQRCILWLATGFGLGRCPVAPGTFGALLGVPLALGCALLRGLPHGTAWEVAACAAVVLAAIPVCGAAENALGRIDDRRIVADEYATVPLCLLGLPWREHLWILPAAFVVHRLLDVLKPPPAAQAQNLVGGLGIVLDDVVSSLYALAINHAAFRLVAYIVARAGA